MAVTPRPKIGLVLSGGGARGFAHIGLMRVLERYAIEVDALAGTSMGAILGALYAHGLRADDLQDLAASVSWRDVIDLSLVGGMIKGARLHELLATHLPARFEDLERPLAVTCTDIEAAEEVVFTDGDLITALRASACVPGAFEPVELDGRTLADGGILNNLPVDALALMRTNLTLASDVSPARRAVYVAVNEEPSSWWQRMVETVTLERRAPLAAVTFRAADIMMRLLTDAQYIHHPADLRVQHEMPEIRMESFWALDDIVAQGEVNAEAALRAHPELLARLQAASRPPKRRRRSASGADHPQGARADAREALASTAGGDPAAAADGAVDSDEGHRADDRTVDGVEDADAGGPGGARRLWSHLRRG